MKSGKRQYHGGFVLEQTYEHKTTGEVVQVIDIKLDSKGTKIKKLLVQFPAGAAQWVKKKELQR